MSKDGERDDGRPPFMPVPVPASPEAGAPPRFQLRPDRSTPARPRKPLPPHIVKQILALGVGRRRWVDPVRLEMAARRRATKPERDKARAEPSREMAEGHAPVMSDPPDIPKPRFQAAPRHIVKEILETSNARLRSRHPRLLEMQARVRAKREAREAKAKKNKDG